MLIRTGQVSLKVDSLEAAVRLVTDAAISVGGVASGAAIHTGERQARTATLELKVPADRYDAVMGRLPAAGRVVSSTTTTADVGEEFVDITARVANARRLEERLAQLLATRAGKLEEALAVERELARVREEVERYQGRLRYLQSRVAMSTITVELFEPAPIVGQPGSNVVVDALKQSWRNFVEVLAAGIALAGGLAPVVLVLGSLGLAVRRWRRRHAAQPAG
jgi:hypothetical protein